MRFKIDENLHDDVADLLAKAGHDAKTVHDEGLRGCADTVLAQHCLIEARIIVMLDLDFADIRAFPPAGGTGMMVLRVRNQSRPHILKVLAQAIPMLERESVAGKLWIISESGGRIRSG